jgi:hypothetical protein
VKDDLYYISLAAKCSIRVGTGLCATDVLQWDPATGAVDVAEQDCGSEKIKKYCDLKDTHFQWAKGSDPKKTPKKGTSHKVEINRGRLEEKYSFVNDHAPYVWLTGPWYPSSVDYHLKYTKPVTFSSVMNTGTVETLPTPDS